MVEATCRDLEWLSAGQPLLSLTKELNMRHLVLGVCVLTAACSADSPGPPTAPSNVASGTAFVVDQDRASVPFRGTVQAIEAAELQPPNALVKARGEGTATHLGRFRSTYEVVVDLATGVGRGQFMLTAANGDSLRGSLTGQSSQTSDPLVHAIEETAVIEDGTGRFAQARGTFRIQRTLRLDTGASSGSFRGTLHLLGH